MPRNEAQAQNVCTADLCRRFRKIYNRDFLLTEASECILCIKQMEFLEYYVSRTMSCTGKVAYYTKYIKYNCLCLHNVDR